MGAAVLMALQPRARSRLLLPLPSAVRKFTSLAGSAADFDHFSHHLFSGSFNRLIRRAGRG
jgi:hypothetical protein